jgi:hypothetical protein
MNRRRSFTLFWSRRRGLTSAIILRSAGGAVGAAMLRTLTCTSGTGRSTDMVDEVKKCEARSCGKASLDSIAP